VFITYESYTDYYFICQLNVTVIGDATAMFDVALTFDGELDLGLPIKTTTTSALEVTFTPDDFGQHFRQTVRYDNTA